MTNWLEKTFNDAGKGLADVGRKAVQDVVTEATGAVAKAIIGGVVDAVTPHEEKTNAPLPPALNHDKDETK